MRLTLSQTKTGRLELFPLMLNSTGSHLVQLIVDPPTAVTFLEHGISSDDKRFICEMCWKCARQILAPLSGNACWCIVDPGF